MSIDDPIETRRRALADQISERLHGFVPSGRWADYGRMRDFIDGIDNPHQDGRLWEAKAIAEEIVNGEFEVFATLNHISGDVHVWLGSFIDPQDDYYKLT